MHVSRDESGTAWNMSPHAEQEAAKAGWARENRLVRGRRRLRALGVLHKSCLWRRRRRVMSRARWRIGAAGAALAGDRADSSGKRGMDRHLASWTPKTVGARRGHGR